MSKAAEILLLTALAAALARCSPRGTTDDGSAVYNALLEDLILGRQTAQFSDREDRQFAVSTAPIPLRFLEGVEHVDIAALTSCVRSVAPTAPIPPEPEQLFDRADGKRLRYSSPLENVQVTADRPRIYLSHVYFLNDQIAVVAIQATHPIGRSLHFGGIYVLQMINSRWVITGTCSEWVS
jgi:hypothetical protein